jgi:Spy/CpxP family protein refolding chaperone
MQKKSAVAVLAVVGALLLSSVPLFAQAAQGAGPNDPIDTDIKLLREDVRSERKQFVAANLPLTDTEATKFWPIYDQYSAEVWKIGDARVELIKEYVQSYDTMTDAQANDFMNRSAAIDQQFSALLTKYVPIFEKVISPKKTARWYQIDRRLDLLINVQLAANIPIVDASK